MHYKCCRILPRRGPCLDRVLHTKQRYIYVDRRDQHRDEVYKCADMPGGRDHDDDDYIFFNIRTANRRLYRSADRAPVRGEG